jgi:two-component system sensor histidine kinase AlgZ
VSDPPSRSYWPCQLAGWGLYATVTVYQLERAGLSLSRSLVEVTTAVLTGLVLTHIARRRIRSRRWVRLPAPALALRAIGAAAVQSLVHVTIGATLEMGIYGDRPRSALLVVVFASMRWTMVYFIWLALYLGSAILEDRRQTELTTLRLEKELTAAQLTSLKAQLNPHFLFNSLNSLRALISEDPERARTTVTQLARTLRYTLNAGKKDVVPLHEEMEIARDYLELESLRLGERLCVETALSDESLAARVPVMLVQTLVENAIKHGIAELPAGGTLGISSEVVDGALVLRVENPRPSQPAPPLEERSASVGLANARERLRLLFGEQASLALALEEGRAIALARVPQ